MFATRLFADHRDLRRSGNNCNDVIDEANPAAAVAGNTATGASAPPASTTASAAHPVRADQLAQTENWTLGRQLNGSTHQGDPGGGGGCNTGNPGICAAGSTTASAAPSSACRRTRHRARSWNGLEGQLAWLTDEGDPGGGGGGNTGNPGICAAGSTTVSGALQCVQTSSPQGETCNGLDDDCNGLHRRERPRRWGQLEHGQPGHLRRWHRPLRQRRPPVRETNSPQAETWQQPGRKLHRSTDEGNPGGGAGRSTGQ